MINIKRCDLNNLEKVNSGIFGTVYRDNDLAYKIYNNHCYDRRTGMNYNNPMKLYRKHRINRMIRLDKKLEYTDLCNDVIFMDGEFSGVCIPFYGYDSLYKLLGMPFDVKMDISNQLVRNSQELTRFRIYPLDLKLDNIMYVDGQVKIIDLDDLYTKYMLIPSRRYKRTSINRLDGTIKNFLGDYDLCRFKEFQNGNGIVRPKYKQNYDYDGVIDYLDDKNKKREFLIVDYKLLDEETIPRLLSLEGYNIIITCNKNEIDKAKSLISRIVSNINEHNGSVFDIIEYEDIDRYFTNFNVGDLVKYNGQFIKVR